MGMQPQSSDPYLQGGYGEGGEMAVPPQPFEPAENADWMVKEKGEPYPEPYADPNKPADSFPSTGFPAPLPGGMGHPYSLNYQHPQAAASGRLAGGFGSSDPNLTENVVEPVQEYKWVEC